LLPRRGVQAIHELPLQSLSPFYRIHDGFASLSSTLDLPDLLEAPDNTVAGSCFYIYPAIALKRANRYPSWVRFARVDRNCVACASRREKRSKKIAYIERNGDRILDDYSPLAFVGDTIYNLVAKTCCGKSVLEMQAGSSLSNRSIRALADRPDVADICMADIKGVRPRGEQEVGPRTAPKGEEGVSSSSSPINSQSEEDLFEEAVPCPLAPSIPVFATGQPDAVMSQMSSSLRRHTGLQDPLVHAATLSRPGPGPRHNQTRRLAPRPNDTSRLPQPGFSGSDEEWEPQHWTGSTTPTLTEKPEHA